MRETTCGSSQVGVIGECEGGGVEIWGGVREDWRGFMEVVVLCLCGSGWWGRCRSVRSTFPLLYYYLQQSSKQVQLYIEQLTALASFGGLLLGFGFSGLGWFAGGSLRFLDLSSSTLCVFGRFFSCFHFWFWFFLFSFHLFLHFLFLHLLLNLLFLHFLLDFLLHLLFGCCFLGLGLCLFLLGQFSCLSLSLFDFLLFFPLLLILNLLQSPLILQPSLLFFPGLPFLFLPFLLFFPRLPLFLLLPGNFNSLQNFLTSHTILAIHIPAQFVVQSGLVTAPIVVSLVENHTQLSKSLLLLLALRCSLPTQRLQRAREATGNIIQISVVLAQEILKAEGRSAKPKIRFFGSFEVIGKDSCGSGTQFEFILDGGSDEVFLQRRIGEFLVSLDLSDGNLTFRGFVVKTTTLALGLRVWIFCRTSGGMGSPWALSSTQSAAMLCSIFSSSLMVVLASRTIWKIQKCSGLYFSKKTGPFWLRRFARCSPNSSRPYSRAPTTTLRRPLSSCASSLE